MSALRFDRGAELFSLTRQDGSQAGSSPAAALGRLRRLALGSVLFSLLWLLESCATQQLHNLAAFAPPTEAQRSDFDVLTQHDNAARTGANLFETRLEPEKVASPSFQRLFQWSVDGQIYGQPLYLSQVVVGNRTMNMVIVTTMNNSVYAFEAPDAGSDQQPSPYPLWQVDKRTLGAPLLFDYFPMKWWILGFNIKPSIGIVSTPVIDRQLGLVYVTAKSGSGGWFFGLGRHIHYKLFAIEFRTGKVKPGVEIAAEGKDATGAVVAKFDASRELQRAGLLEANGQIYLAFASHQDSTPYHGWVLAYDAKSLAQTGVYCTTCAHVRENDCDASCEGGIWQAGGGPVADRAGNIYVMTGNGTFDREDRKSVV